jgi:uncharacterized protein (DUF885 family)
MTVSEDFRRLAERIVDDLLETDPVSATWLGDHRYDDRLADLSAPGLEAQLRRVDDHITALDAVDDVELGVSDLVDLEILRARLLRTVFELDDVRRHEWDPMVWNPGTSLHLLLSREFAPADERAQSLRGRIAAIGDHFSSARTHLDEMSAIHLDTAIAQLAGTRALLDSDARTLAADDDLVDRAVREIDDFCAWLDERRPRAVRDPRLGDRLYGGALWHALDDGISADSLLSDAHAHLRLLSEQLRDAAREYLGPRADDAGDDLIRVALDEVAGSATVTDATVLPLMQAALDRTTSFVRERDLVDVPDLDVRIIDMPEIHRGVAVAYCDAPGPLESAGVATYVAVAPTPVGWDAKQVASFYREYNAVQLHGLAVHEAMPGHVLQLAHAQRVTAPTRVRRFGRSGVFIEGWAVYAEEMMVAHGYSPEDDPRSAAALRLQQLKMQLRSVINTILDIGVHAHDMSEAEGMWLMCEAGFQEEREAIGKWRRALLTAAQLPTYYAGYRAVSGIVEDLRVMHEDWSDRQLHDLVLSQGSPAPRHLRTLLGI